MIKVNKPINLSQLDKEYNGQGLIADVDDNGEIILVGLADNNFGDEKELLKIIENHNAIFIDRLAAKAALLEKLGITEEEAKLLLS